MALALLKRAVMRDLPRALVAFVLLAACDGGSMDVRDGEVPSVTDGGPDEVCEDGGCYTRRCRDLTYFDGEAEPGLVIGARRDGVVIPYEDGGDAVYEFGFQGGAMILPTLQVPAAATATETCVQVVLRHREDPAHPGAAGDAPGFVFRLTDPMRRDGDVAWIGPLQDQIGWDAPDGRRLVLEAEVRGVDFAYRGEVAIRLVDADGWDECDTIPTQFRFGCEYVTMGGALTVDAVGDTTGLGCDDLVSVTTTLTPEEPIPDGCLTLTRTQEFSRGCVDEHGLTEGARLEGQWWELPMSGSCDGFLETSLRQEFCSCP